MIASVLNRILKIDQEIRDLVPIEHRDMCWKVKTLGARIVCISQIARAKIVCSHVRV